MWPGNRAADNAEAMGGKPISPGTTDNGTRNNATRNNATRDSAMRGKAKPRTKRGAVHPKANRVKTPRAKILRAKTPRARILRPAAIKQLGPAPGARALTTWAAWSVNWAGVTGRAA